MPDLESNINSRDILNQIFTVVLSGNLKTTLNTLPLKTEQPSMDQGGVWENKPCKQSLQRQFLYRKWKSLACKFS